MRHRRKVRDNVWYIVTPDPTQPDSHESWHIVIDGGKYNRIVGKYTNIKIRDKGTSISYDFHTKWLPPEFDDRHHNSKEFDELIQEILVDWLRYAHKEGMMKYAPLTPEMRDKEEYTVNE